MTVSPFRRMFRFFFGLRINLSVDSVFFYFLLFFSFLFFFFFCYFRAAKTRAPIFYTVRFNRYAIMVIVASFRFAGRTIYPPVLSSFFYFFFFQSSSLRDVSLIHSSVSNVFFFFFYYFSDVRWTISGQSSLIFVKKKKKKGSWNDIPSEEFHILRYRPICM